MNFNRIGVWQTAFLGDAILTLPLLQSLSDSFPESEIYFFVRKGLKSLFDAGQRWNVVEFDKLGRDNGASGIFRMSAFIRKLDLDLWISPHTSFRSAMTALLGRAKTRISYSYPLHNRLACNYTVPRRFNELEEIERILELLKPLNLSPGDAWPRIELSSQAIQKADEFWRKHIRGKTLGIHPGSTWPTKMWPGEYFTRVIEMARDLPDTQVIIFAGPGEEGMVQDILSGLSGTDKVISLAGELSLPDLAAFLSRLDCYLTNDSGPMHLAWPQNVPTIALFGPTVRSLGFFPRGEKTIILESGLPCRPCGLHGHKNCPEKHHLCMKNILPETVLSAVRDTLYA